MRAFTLTLGALTALALPSAVQAASLTNTFLSSSSGTTTIEVSDTIQFEVHVTLDSGVEWDVVLWNLSGDISAAAGSTIGSGWAGVSNNATNWAWHYSPAGTGSADLGMTDPSFILPPAAPTPDRVAGAYGAVAALREGTGVAALVGTVTIHADSVGSFLGGAFHYVGASSFITYEEGEDQVFHFTSPPGGAFTVVPEPSTAILIAGGLAALARRRRRSD